MRQAIFKQKVMSVVTKIPRGSVKSYKQVAAAAGNDKAARAVGAILHRNFNPRLPCHRVVRSDGSPGGYNRGKAAKVRLLRAEGVEIQLV